VQPARASEVFAGVAERALHIVRGGASWPSELSEIAAPPDELWLRGRRELLARRTRVAIVGTRSPTAYGESQARRFASELAALGAVVVSGLARGIDDVAHRAALDVGGATIAVLGSGVDRAWPDTDLVQRIAADGLLLSEFPPGTPPRKHHFPQRNRLISGLCQAVLVVEAAHASGSLITARWAADQGRQVFALPGRVDHPMARGCHRLIREGAALVESPDDVIAELGLEPSRVARGVARAPPEPESAREVGGLHAELLGALRGETLSADELTERTRGSLSDVLTALVELELAGDVVRGAGALYRLP
jgi:DNA processing protein